MESPILTTESSGRCVLLLLLKITTIAGCVVEFVVADVAVEVWVIVYANMKATQGLTQILLEVCVQNRNITLVKSLSLLSLHYQLNDVKA